MAPNIVSRGRRQGKRHLARRAVAAWNRDYQPGARVFIEADNGVKIETVTASHAWDANGHAVVLIAGGLGVTLLANVKPMPTAKATA